MFARLHIKHEVYKSAFQSRAGAVENCKTRSCNLRGAIEIKYSQGGAKIDVIFRLKIKFRFRAPATNLNIVGFIFAGWHTSMRSVWERRQQIAHARLKFVPPVVTRCNALLEKGHYFAPLSGFFAFSFFDQRPNFPAGCVALSIELI